MLGFIPYSSFGGARRAQMPSLPFTSRPVNLGRFPNSWATTCRWPADRHHPPAMEVDREYEQEAWPLRILEFADEVIWS
jgi:hypothetical protein